MSRFRLRRVPAVLCGLLLGLPVRAQVPAQADDMKDTESLIALLARGPMVLVENDAAGKFSEATALVTIDRPIEEVWAVVSDFARFHEFMPRVVRSEVAPAGEGAATGLPEHVREVDVTIEVSSPVLNTRYSMRYRLDARRREAHGRWLRGHLKDSRASWRLVELGPERTLLHYSTATRNMSSFLAALDDEHQTITVGVNAGASVAAVQALKRRCEQRRPAPRPDDR